MLKTANYVKKSWINLKKNLATRGLLNQIVQKRRRHDNPNNVTRFSGMKIFNIDGSVRQDIDFDTFFAVTNNLSLYCGFNLKQLRVLGNLQGD